MSRFRGRVAVVTGAGIGIGKEIAPRLAAELGISEEDVVKKAMLKDAADRQFAPVEEAAAAVPSFAGASGTALTGRSMMVTHGWFMQERAHSRAVVRQGPASALAPAFGPARQAPVHLASGLR